MKDSNSGTKTADEKKPPGQVVSSVAQILSICEANYAYL